METTIHDEIAAYQVLSSGLEADHTGEWALLHHRELIGLFDSFEAAAEDAVKRFGRETYLIRQIGAPPVTLPASVMYTTDGGDPLRLRR